MHHPCAPSDAPYLRVSPLSALSIARSALFLGLFNAPGSPHANSRHRIRSSLGSRRTYPEGEAAGMPIETTPPQSVSFGPLQACGSCFGSLQPFGLCLVGDGPEKPDWRLWLVPRSLCSAVSPSKGKSSGPLSAFVYACLRPALLRGKHCRPELRRLGWGRVVY